MKNIKLIILSLLLFSGIGIAQPTSWQPVGIGGGGALFSPSINPSNPNEIYMGCDMTSLFKTTTQGSKWVELPFQQIQGGLFSEVQFTKDPTIRYCVNHAAKDNVDRLRPFKTDDNGKTWYPLIAPINESGGVLRLFADYNSPSRIIVADYHQIFISTNGGGNFTRIYQSPTPTLGNHIAGVCFDGSSIYIACEDGIYCSKDNGNTWTWMTCTGLATGEKILSFTYARTGNALKFVCLTANRVWAGIRPGSTYWDSMRGIFTMKNTNGTWTRHTAGISSANGDYVVWLGMARNDTSTVYAAGGNSSLKPVVMKSVNGQAWTHKFMQVNNQNILTGWSGQQGDANWDYGSAPQGFQVCPINPNIVITTDLGFAHITTDGGTTWRQLYVSPNDQNTMGVNTPKKKLYRSIGLENTGSWHITWLDQQRIMAGYTDIGGISSPDGGKNWKMTAILENSTYRILKNNDGKVYAATSSVHDLYQSDRIYDQSIDAGGGKIYYSKDNGISFSVLKDFQHPVVWLTIDPNNITTMYAAVAHSDTAIGGIYKTTTLQQGTSAIWTKLPSPQRANGHPFNIHVLQNGDVVATFSARMPTPTSAFMATSGIFYFNNTTKTWSDRSHPSMYYWTKDITIDPNDITQNTWYVAVFQGWGNVAMQGTGGLYRTKDRGITWTKISNEFRVNSATVHPYNANLLYYTTETNGLWYSQNATANMPTFSQVASYTFRHPVRVFFNPYILNEIWVASFGGGTKIGIDRNLKSQPPLLMMIPQTPQYALASLPEDTETLKIAIIPNPTGGLINIKFDNQPNTPINFEIFDTLGKPLLCEETDGSSSWQSINISSLPMGVYILKVSNNTNTQMLRFIKEF
jgi:Secretion system C-terminal sorting domain